MYFSLIQIILKMPRRSRARRGQEEDIWFVVKDRRGIRRDYILQARWDLTAAVVARYVAGEVGAEVFWEQGTMLCRSSGLEDEEK